MNGMHNIQEEKKEKNTLQTSVEIRIELQVQHCAKPCFQQSFL